MTAHDKIFAKVKLPSNINATILEAKGIHYFTSLSISKVDIGDMMRSLIKQLVLIEEKEVNEKYFNDMDMRDISYLSEVFNLMLSTQAIDIQ